MNLQRSLHTLINQDSESGQSMVEYALVTALIAVVAMAAIEGLGGGIVSIFGDITGEISGV